MNVQVVRRLLGLGVLLAVMGGVSPLGQVESVWAQEAGEQQEQSGSATDASAEGLLQAAGALLQKGDIPGALQLLELALKRYQAEEHQVGEMRVLAKMGEAYKQQKSYEEAIAAFKEALGIASQGDNLNNVGWLQNQIGIAHFRLNWSLDKIVTSALVMARAPMEES